MKQPNQIKQFDVWIADLNPPNGTEPGKIRPVVIVQTDLLNNFHPSTLICPVTTNIFTKAEILRVNMSKNEAGLKQRSAILVDQLRAIDNKRLVKRLGRLNKSSRERLIDNLKVIMEL
ncbi:MAG: type II toxin-antitoxin system PemK/MazF family toxin [Ignavibacteria bacterium]|nr:type II toxin-antitoxin system PemK/MazF family toxin [Ignavibacteria bacterium]